MTKELAVPSKEEVKKALDEMGVGKNDVQIETILGDPVKCREFVGKLQGPEAIEEETDLAMAKYQVRARKFVKLLTTTGKAAKAAGDKPVKPEAKKKPEGEAAKPAAEAAEEPPADQPKEKNVATKKVTKKAAKAAKAKAAKPAAKKGGAKPGVAKVGVIAELKDILKNGGGTIEQIYAKLVKKFPGRGEGMKTTIRIQVNRLVKNGTMKVKREKVEGSNEVKYWA